MMNDTALVRAIISWSFQEDIRRFVSEGDMENLENTLVTEFPLRFLNADEYITSFKIPAILEFKASVLNSVISEPPQVFICSIHFAAEESSCKISQSKYEDIVIRFHESGNKPSVPIDSLCALSTGPSLLNGTCILGIAISGRATGGIKLRVDETSVPLLRNGNTEWYIQILSSMVSSNREFEALCSIESIPLKTEILLGLSTASTSKEMESHTQALPQPLMEAFSAKLNLAQNTVIASLCGYRNQQERNRRHPRVFLVKGPPGTGKTLTLSSILNAIHVRQYNEYYDAIASAVRSGRINNNEKSWLDLTRVAKPRIIVCAPSNVAIDNIILRIQSEKFLDGKCRAYVPSLVRIGKGSTQNQEVAKRALSKLVEKLTAKPGKEIHERISKLEGLYSEYRHGVLLQVTKLNCLIAGTPYRFKRGIETRITTTPAGLFTPYWVDHVNQTTTVELPPRATSEDEQGISAEEMPEWSIYIEELTRYLELWEETHWKLQRYRLVLSWIQDGVGSGGPHSAAASAERYQLQHNLETIFLNQAAIVCGTLNSTGLSQVRESSPFHTCVVDEAAQAVELSTLIPLRLGVKQLVLVGDPQQLPATVIAKREHIGNYERSLFERLEQCGVPVHTLDIQYRMHPAISLFPRNMFYQGLLKDAPCVSERVPFFTKPPFNLNPFLFIDLLLGREQISQSFSRSNHDEAAVSVSLYFALLRIAQLEGVSLHGRVGIISPYSEQVRVLKTAFEGAGVKAQGGLDDIEFATVDSFQGKEKDIIILSTVRACSESNDVGFLSDIRRMNVAITRAKIGLFVVGNSQTLVSNPHWQSLINQARSTKSAYIQVRGPADDIFGILAQELFSHSNTK
jgi:senataxin